MTCPHGCGATLDPAHSADDRAHALYGCDCRAERAAAVCDLEALVRLCDRAATR